jgi:hypothetical protein
MKNNNLRLLWLILLSGFQAGICSAQNTQTETPKIFLNCTSWNCYEDYVRTELSLFDYVRDRFEADIQILIIRQETGAGGSQFTLNFIGQKTFGGLNDTLQFATKQADSEDMIRQQLVKSMKMGLVRYISKTNLIDKMSVDFTKREAKEALIQKDKWDYWVFNLGGNVFMDGESNRYYLSLSNYLSINRITPESKFTFSANYNQNVNKFKINEEEIKVKNESYNFFGQYVKSLGEHWSLGGVYRGFHSIFSNINYSQRIAPAIEYSFFPYKDNTRRQLRAVYQAGIRHQTYLEETVFDKTAELLPYHNLNILLNFTQPWGSLNVSVYGSQFLHDPNKYRAGVFLDMSWRIFEGFSLNCYGGMDLIKDQISLAKSALDPDEILLRSRQLPTSFNYFTSIGISYTFGSINNSVVNPRFNGID